MWQKIWSGESHQRGGNQPENYQLVEGDRFGGDHTQNECIENLFSIPSCDLIVQIMLLYSADHVTL